MTADAFLVEIKSSRSTGNIWLLLLALALPLILLVFFKPNLSFNVGQEPIACVTPDSNQSIDYNLPAAVLGANIDENTVKTDNIDLRPLANLEPYRNISGTFEKVRGVTGIPSGVFPFHFAKAGTVNYEGKDRQVYVSVTECEGIKNGTNCTAENQVKVSAVNFAVRPVDSLGTGAFNIIYLMVDDDPTKVPVPDPSLHYFEIFLKRGAALPDYIKTYCEQYGDENYGQATTNQFIFPGSNSIQPPMYLDAKVGTPNITDERVLSYQDPNNASCPNGTCDDSLQRHRELGEIKDLYKLVGYAPIDSPVTIAQQIESDTLNISRSIKANYTDNDRQYYLGFVSYAKFFVLIPKDDPTKVYYYQAVEARDDNIRSVQDATATAALQLTTLRPYDVASFGWWTPECKPAIYLYPTQTTRYNVVVKPAGYLTYTDPLYPANGWDVVVDPSGHFSSNGQDYTYLYYESKIKDHLIDIPTHGYVRSYAELNSLYQYILPKLGLNAQETADYIEYWQKYLPYSPYYFVGVMSEPSIEKIEPLYITPQPDTNIRVRLYYQALDYPTAVPEPELTAPVRVGNVMVEWGGMVKQDKDHPFTCSQ